MIGSGRPCGKKKAHPPIFPAGALNLSKKSCSRKRRVSFCGCVGCICNIGPIRQVCSLIDELAVLPCTIFGSLLIVCCIVVKTGRYLQKSFFRNRARSKIITPQETESVGIQASRTARSGGISEKQIGPKKIIKVITIIKIKIILSFLVLGGVKKIFAKSIFTIS